VAEEQAAGEILNRQQAFEYIQAWKASSDRGSDEETIGKPTRTQE
jgi:hypothetical protein